MDELVILDPAAVSDMLRDENGEPDMVAIREWVEELEGMDPMAIPAWVAWRRVIH